MQLPLFYLVWISLIQSTISYPLVIDLTHTITPNIPYFPSQTRFNFTQIFAGWVNDEKPFFYSTNAFTTSEHMGTHLDAPYHFYTEGWKVDEIPLERLIAVPTRIIDVSKQCKNNRNYLITIEDLQKSNLKFPSRKSKNPKKFYFILLFYTGWSEFWPNQRLYAGPDDSDLQFPGLSEELTEYLISEYGANLVGVGIDTLSSKHFWISCIVCVLVTSCFAFLFN